MMYYLFFFFVFSVFLVGESNAFREQRCDPDVKKFDSLKGFCVGFADLEEICDELEIGVSTQNCSEFEGFFCCYGEL